MRLGERGELAGFVAALNGTALAVDEVVFERLHTARAIVDAAALGEAPVYGLNTGLGANLDHRLATDEITAFQHQLIAGRAVAVGPPLPARVGRAWLLARLFGVAQGVSGMSVPMFDHLCAVWRAGLAPAVPAHGSIGASDLTQNAVGALALLGQGQIWVEDELTSADEALAGAGLTLPDLQPKDAMALINHGGMSAARAGLALHAANEALQMTRQAAALACRGYGVNALIFATEVNRLRTAPGQAEVAAWFHEALKDASARRVQDPLSFRTLASVLGATRDALDRAITIWEDEINGASDSPAVVGAQAMASTPNFQAPALGLAMEQVSLAMAMVGQGAVMRVQRLMDPDLTGLPRYLSPVGGASAGFVPLQKTAAALLAEVRRHAQPVLFDPAPVSDGVEDMAPMTAQTATKLEAQMEALRHLAGIEAMVAAQACDLRGLPSSALHSALRTRIASLKEDRALGPDIDMAVEVLQRYVSGTPRA